jgi:CheY-like chemotaxis protein
MKRSPAPARILLVDGSADGLLVRRSLLEEAGCQVEVAHGGEEALARLGTSAFDVVVTAYRIARMNGSELIARIRKLNPAARIVLLCDFIEGLGLSERNTGANVVIVKNASEPAHLVRWVKRLASAAPPRRPAAKS